MACGGTQLLPTPRGSTRTEEMPDRPTRGRGHEGTGHCSPTVSGARNTGVGQGPAWGGQRGPNDLPQLLPRSESGLQGRHCNVREPHRGETGTHSHTCSGTCQTGAGAPAGTGQGGSKHGSITALNRGSKEQNKTKCAVSKCKGWPA